MALLVGQPATSHVTVTATGPFLGYLEVLLATLPGATPGEESGVGHLVRQRHNVSLPTGGSARYDLPEGNSPAPGTYNWTATLFDQSGYEGQPIETKRGTVTVEAVRTLPGTTNPPSSSNSGLLIAGVLAAVVAAGFALKGRH